MRRISVAIITMLMVMILSLSSLFGCNLITTNNKRDMNQTVATVQLDETAPKEVILKKDMIIAYLNYYYTLEQQGSSRAAVFEQIIDELVNNRLYVQYAMKYFSEKDGETTVNWDITHYLDDKQELDAKFSAYRDMNELIDNYVTDKEGDKLTDSNTGTSRVVPTGATNAEFEGKQTYLDQCDQNNFYIGEKRNAFTKVINLLKTNDLLGDEYTTNDITTTEYYKETLNSYQEQLLIENFQKDLEKTAREKISYENVKTKYEEIYADQKDNLPAASKQVLSNASASTPVLYNKGVDGFGMVYHVLLKIDDKLTKDLADLKEELKSEEDENSNTYKNAEYRKKRAEKFESITATDLRSSWITSGYDFKKQETAPISAYQDYKYTFTGDYTLYANQSLPFFGTVTHLNKQDEPATGTVDIDYKPSYRIDSLRTFSLDDMVSLVNTYLYGGTATADTSTTRSVDGKVKYQGTPVSDFEDRVKELMFAFSGDDGDTALNTYKGYLIKPEPDTTETEEWMLEFAETGRELIKANSGTYYLVATDYGYHFMFFSENFNSYDYPELKDYLNKQYGVSENDAYWKNELTKMIADWDDYKDTDNYMYVLHGQLASALASKAFDDEKLKIDNEYGKNSNVVVRYEDAYKDLLK